MNADLERLIALQRLDSAAHDAQRRLADEPERLKAFDARLERRAPRWPTAKERLAENQTARRAIEKDVAVHQGRLSKFRDQLMAVKTNVEYQAMQKEIEFAQTEVKTLEDRILERMLEADDLTAAVKRAEAELAAEQKAVDADRKALRSGARRAAGDGSSGSPRSARDLVRRARPAGARDLRAGRQAAQRRGRRRSARRHLHHLPRAPAASGVQHRPAQRQILQCDSCNRILYFVPGAPAAAAASLAHDAGLPNR